eukprot:TRINITY_DN469_c0_g1_i9.p1 TRINITY_DN469_c0_g1~~TRINITY_DN469_c0_g1_i9.p1  ORF type:complete len:333 (+),score=33.86 TRINITY_DN469_c0_g1_i9:134-1132(+)
MDDATATPAVLKQRILRRIDECGLEGVDFLICMFFSALTSYRRSTLCDPFPPFHTRGDTKDWNTVDNLLRTLPDVKKLAQLLNNEGNEDVGSISLEHLRIVDWLLDKNIRLKIVKSEEISHRLGFNSSASQSSTHHHYPSLAFEILHETADSPFHQLRDVHGFQNAFHGSQFENFWSILNKGLQVRFSKETSIFGDGIYLSDDPLVAHNFVQSNKVWENSALGGRLGCVCGCEVLSHPDVRKGRRGNTNGIMVDHQLPESYIVVQRNHHLLVKYLLVYSEPKVIKYANSSSTMRRLMSSSMVVFLYILLLILIACVKSPTIKKWWKTSSLLR